MKSKRILSAASAALVLISSPAIADVAVTFSGGGGTPLSITLPELTWSITNPAFFDSSSLFGVGIAVGQTPATVSYGGASSGGNTADWSSDGSTIFPSASAQTFYSNNSFGGANDGGIIWFGVLRGGTSMVGDMVTYAGGTIGTSINVTESYLDGNYEVYLISGVNNLAVSDMAVPEPSTYAFLSGFAALALVIARRRLRSVA